jgi:hypothetical protein
MLKSLRILAGAILVVAAILVAVYYQQRYAVGKGYDIKCEQSSNPSSAANSLACVIYPSQNTEDAHPNPQWWNVLLAWPEGITAWLLLLTLGGIAWQAWETRKAAEASQRSLLVQEAEFFQWLDMGDWSFEQDPQTNWTSSGYKETTPTGPMKARISFSLANNTSRKLFVRYVRTTLIIGADRDHCAFATEEATEVPPKNEYKVVIDIVLNEAQVNSYTMFMLPIEAFVHVRFDNALKNPSDSDFRRLIYCHYKTAPRVISKGYISKKTD